MALEDTSWWRAAVCLSVWHRRRRLVLQWWYICCWVLDESPSLKIENKNDNNKAISWYIIYVCGCIHRYVRVLYCNCKGRNLSSYQSLALIGCVAYSGVGPPKTSNRRAVILTMTQGEEPMKALAQSALTEVATELGCVVFVDENILSACGANSRPCTGGKLKIGERFGVRYISFPLSFFLFLLSRRKKKKKTFHSAF